jgi:hypothetical protein
LERLLKIKERQKDEAMHIEDTQKGWLERLRNAPRCIVFGGKQKKTKLLLRDKREIKSGLIVSQLTLVRIIAASLVRNTRWSAADDPELLDAHPLTVNSNCFRHFPT